MLYSFHTSERALTKCLFYSIKVFNLLLLFWGKHLSVHSHLNSLLRILGLQLRYLCFLFIFNLLNTVPFRYLLTLILILIIIGLLNFGFFILLLLSWQWFFNFDLLSSIILITLFVFFFMFVVYLLFFIIVMVVVLVWGLL